MKLIIAGSRTVTATPEEIKALVEHYNLKPTEIVSGTAHGMDRCGEDFAHKFGIPVAEFPADWDRYGKSAGHRRNSQMAEYGDALLLIWDGQSPGSKGMKNVMTTLGKPVFEAIVVINPKSVVPDGNYSIGSNLSEKVHYVKSQGQTRNHHCHWPTCNEQVPPAQWGCKKHWFKLPKRLRDRIWATYKPGQEKTMTPSRAYLLVADEVQRWITENNK